MKTLTAACSLALLAGSALAQTPAPNTPSLVPPQPEARVGMVGNDGRTIGTVDLFRAAGGVLMRFNLTGVTPGWHGVHFHMVGDCGDQRRFQRAGGHINHARAQHGLLNLAGAEAGDLPNVYAAANGEVHAELLTSRVRLGGTGAGQNLVDRDGSAIVLHANMDDHVNQPIGGAGDRIACGVIRASNGR